MRAVILAAGKGTRLLPFTKRKPKQMIPLAGKPLIAHIISSLRNARINEILIIIGRFGGLIKEYLNKLGLNDADLLFEEQPDPKGTAHALKYAESFTGSSPFLLTYGDVIFDTHVLNSLIDIFQDTGETAITVAKAKDPRYLGVVETEGSKVIKIIEKPTNLPTGISLVNAGCYIFTQTIFECLDRVRKSIRRELELTDAINMLISNGSPVYYVEATGPEWLNIDHPWDILNANESLLSKLEVSEGKRAYKGVTLEGYVDIGEDVKLRPGTVVEGPVYIGGGSEIGPNCLLRPYTSIGEQVKIGNACEIKNSIIMSNTKISHLLYIGDSVIGENCNLGAGTITANLRFDEKNIEMIIKHKSLDTGRKKLGAVLGDNVKTGINVSIMPGVKIGMNSAIGPNLLVDRDVPDNTLLMVRQQVHRKKLELQQN